MSFIFGQPLISDQGTILVPGMEPGFVSTKQAPYSGAVSLTPCMLGVCGVCAVMVVPSPGSEQRVEACSVRD